MLPDAGSKHQTIETFQGSHQRANHVPPEI
jgi:hypothetical protein